MKLLIGSFARLLGFFIAHLPRPARNFLGDALAFFWFDVLRIRRRIAVDNVTIAFPDKSLPERTAIARASLRNLGRTLMEYSLFPYLKAERVNDRFAIHGEEHLKTALNLGKGAMLATLHLGNGDLAIAGLSLRGYKVSLISKEFKTRWLNDLWFGMRMRLGTKFIAPEKSSFDILRALKRNEIVIFVIDQWMGPPVGVRTQFFGKTTGTAMGLAIMQGRTQSPVIPCYTWRRDDGRHEMVFLPAVPYQDVGDKEKNIAVMTQIYTDRVEDAIRLHPGQWMWIHRRWKEFRD